MTPSESVTVLGAGAARAVPDMLRMDLAAEARAGTVGEALTGANEAMAAMQRAVLAGGVAPEDLRTSSLSIRTERDNRGQVVSGYVANQGLSVELRETSAAGGLVSAATAAGGDAARVNGLQFAVADDGALLEQARKDAIADARVRAETYAVAAGRSVGRVLRITEGTRAEPVPVRAASMAAESGSPVPLQAGAQEVSVTVTVEWALD